MPNSFMKSTPVQTVIVQVWGHFPFPRWLRRLIQWTLSPKFIVGVVALVFDPQGRLLLLKHTYKGRYPWGLPGGGMATTESPVQAIIRETREEAGLRISVLALLGIEKRPRHAQLDIFYLCRSHGGTFRPNAEIVDY